MTYRAPGRVNLIGEHTDYNDGFVMPAAIDRYTCVAITPNAEPRLIVHSEAMDETVEAPLSLATLRPRGDWTDYVLGVAAELLAGSAGLRGATLRITSDLPLGAGLSSSAALEVATGYALLDNADQPIDRRALAIACRRAENEFVGARCGIMDQFITTHGRAGHALLLDCRTLEYEALPLPGEVRLVICNTMVKHSVAAGEYNTRRRECEAAVRALAAHVPKVSALRDVSAKELDRHASTLSPLLLRRARHIVSENERVIAAAAALRRGDLQVFGDLMAQSHRSLRDDFEVSCAELDLMVDLASGCDGVYGARMTGGGFGGCTINLVDAENTEQFVSVMQDRYQDRMGVRAEIYICTATDGVGEAP